MMQHQKRRLKMSAICWTSSRATIWMRKCTCQLYKGKGCSRDGEGFYGKTPQSKTVLISDTTVLKNIYSCLSTEI